MRMRVNDHLAGVALALLASAGAFLVSVAQAADTLPGAPAGELIAGRALKGGELVDDPTAFHGKATTAHGDWASLLELDTPAHGDAFTIWVHHKHGPLQLKTLVNGAQVEKDWKWVAPEGYEWTHMGRYTRADLGKGIIIIREKADKAKDVYIDAVVFSTDAKVHPPGMNAEGVRDLPPEAPDPSLPATAASVRIDWDKAAGQMLPAIWSINDEEVKSVAAASYPGVQAFLASLNPPIIRLLEGGRYKDWTDPKTHAWDAAKIKACYDARKTGYGNARYMYTIPGWPEWLPQKDRFLTPEGEDEFVKFIGQLVVVMRDKVGKRVTYWEVLNEHDERFATWGKLDQLHRLYNRLFAEIKKQDPTAKVGGPALTWANPVWLEPFLKHCAPNVDFVSWHSYASGNIYDSNSYVFGRADAMATEARKAKETVEKATAGRKVECFLDEYNVKWSWEPMERRHHNAVGAVFQACVLRRLGMVGLDGVMVWHSIGGAYGLAEPEPWNVGKPGKNPLKIGQTGRLYQIGSRCVHGSIADTAVEGDKDIELIAVTRADGVRSVLLINRANHTVVVGGADKLGVGRGQDNPTMVRIASDGLSSPQWKQELAGEALRLPGCSVTLVTGDGSIAKLVEKPNQGG